MSDVAEVKEAIECDGSGTCEASDHIQGCYRSKRPVVAAVGVEKETGRGLLPIDACGPHRRRDKRGGDVSDIKRECLGCGAWTSSVGIAYRDGEPCPYCGLSAEATTELLAARKRGADESLQRSLTEAVKERDALRREVAELREIIQRVRSVVRIEGET